MLVPDTVRLARVAQHLRSISELHARELDALADQLDAAGQPELAARLRTFRGLHAEEVGVAIQELEDMHGVQVPGEEPAAESPRRGQWLEEEARRATPQPLTRRELLNLGGETEPD